MLLLNNMLLVIELSRLHPGYALGESVATAELVRLAPAYDVAHAHAHVAHVHAHAHAHVHAQVYVHVHEHVST